MLAHGWNESSRRPEEHDWITAKKKTVLIFQKQKKMVPKGYHCVTNAGLMEEILHQTCYLGPKKHLRKRLGVEMLRINPRNAEWTFLKPITGRA